MLALCTGSVIVDGFQSIGAAAGSHGPGSLRWPLVGSFMGYDRTWGFHWFGWPWLRSWLIPVVSWSPGADVSLLWGLWILTATRVAVLVGKAEGKVTGMAAGFFTLAAPGILTALQSYRPEIPTACALVLLAGCWWQDTKRTLVCRSLLLLILPTLHPLGLVVPGAWCAGVAVLEWCRNGLMAAVRRTLPPVLALAGGVLLFVAWYGLQPDAWAQFKLNLASQRMLVDGMGAGYLTLFRWGLSGRGAIPLLVLLVPAFAYGICLLLRAVRNPKDTSNDILLLPALAIVISFALNVVGRNPNPLHFVGVLPFAVWLVCAGGRKITMLRSGKLLIPVMAVACGLMAVYPAKQAWLLLRSGGESYRNGLAKTLDRLPPSRRVLIPVCLWEAALRPGQGRDFRFSTFPNILPRRERSEYEQMVMADTAPGDLLVWDPLQEQGGVFNFVTATALKHQLIQPIGVEDLWEPMGEISAPVRYSDSQATVFQVFRRK
ncbi:hypothetical protein KBB96_15265 [Luteolibacter ambystomatis]|uniref:Uncharacterized protein n=1 Tax=Luteolibacter ambystomatis TaxID=2824561 RepID=A0A975G773_9BACT|nr:hypothetical protein [Luteolibacter ambystomatis]QUE50223.1 hypothetical protein KBB96_15265 [Luteolibacter ambystomatis]